MFEMLYERWLDRSMLRSESPSVVQSGAMPYTVVDGEVVFLLITSRRSGRWIFPKGAPMEGLTPWQTAKQEALEEAGVVGEVETMPIGSYRTVKRGLRTRVVEVEVYPLKVTEQHEEWQESGQRYRHWAILPEVKRLITDKPIAELAVRLEQKVRGRLSADRSRTAADGQAARAPRSK
ncbi:NUDIX hydrolase [Consotaella salsifontis]|uniref:Predicted NTP pyrophosphohydrolase, NUDIX family n=1 Tax=Consotaella salsifontis TaxID=1365950 RepID=A0A1T4T7F5_9HYPH|nr:NUDIX hydrolase [Consotaella salsifontis]SKA36327.1 Predicted NTP pyrophosphohydrolase, NUDIX family [Consotaella salsifontis]